MSSDLSQHEDRSASSTKADGLKQHHKELDWLASAYKLAKSFVEQHERHHTEGQSDGKTNKRIAVIALAVAAIGAALSFITLMVVSSQTKAAWEQARIAQRSLLISNRAWIDVSFDDNSVDFDWNITNGPTITLDMQTENVGNSPALDTDSVPVLYPGAQVNRLITKAKCDRPPDATYGNTVFIKSKMKMRWGTSISPQDVAEYDRKWSNKIKVPVNRLPTVVLLCATYHIVGDIEWHHTAYAFNIGRVVIDSSGHPAFVMLIKGQNMPKGTMHLQREYEGDYVD